MYKYILSQNKGFCKLKNNQTYPDDELGARGIKLTAPCPNGLVDRLELADKPLLPPAIKQ